MCVCVCACMCICVCQCINVCIHIPTYTRTLLQPSWILLRASSIFLGAPRQDNSFLAYPGLANLTAYTGLSGHPDGWCGSWDVVSSHVTATELRESVQMARHRRKNPERS